MKHHVDLLYLLHLLEAITRIEEYVQRLDENTFTNNFMAQDAVIRQIMVIGEATKLLSPELREKYGQVPWRQIAQLRDTLVHRYFGIDLEKVGETTQEDLPALKLEVSLIIQKLKAEENQS